MLSHNTVSAACMFEESKGIEANHGATSAVSFVAAGLRKENTVN